MLVVCLAFVVLGAWGYLLQRRQRALARETAWLRERMSTLIALVSALDTTRAAVPGVSLRSGQDHPGAQGLVGRTAPPSPALPQSPPSHAALHG